MNIGERIKALTSIEVLNPYGFIYITTNMINGTRYIGQKIFNDKWTNYLGSGQYLKRAIKKYGKENFTREIIALGYDKEELNLLEIAFINNHNAIKSNDYYNIADGGNSGNKFAGFSEERLIEDKLRRRNLWLGEKNPLYGKKYTEAEKAKMSIANSGRKHTEEAKERIIKALYGRPCSDETREKIRESQKGEKAYMYGRCHTEEEKRKIGDAARGEKSYMYGKTVTAEIRKKISDTLMGRPNLICSKKVICTTTNEVFNSLTDAEKYYNNAHEANISRCCSGERKSAGKLLNGTKLAWKFYD